jgi:nucleotide-binding universal stress UspA family protein
MNSRILVPIALNHFDDWAIGIAKQVGVTNALEIEAMHVVQPPAGALLDGAGQVIEDGELDLSTFKAEWAAAEHRLKGLVESGQASSYQLTAGQVTSALVEKSRDVALTVMASEGLSGLQALLHRTEVGEFVFQSKTPVLSVKCDRSDLQPRNVLLIGRFEEVAERPLGILKAWVDSVQGNWHFLAIGAKDTDQCGEREHRMRAFAAKNGIEKVSLHFHRQGDPELAVAQLLQEQEIDVLALAVRKQQSHWLQGGLALALVHHFHKPIYTYPVE